MPPDNAATVAPGADVEFPSNGAILNTNIGRSGADSFILNSIGSYLVMFTVPVTEAGQLVLTLNGTELPYTTAGRATGSSEIIGTTIITTATAGEILTVRNPSANATALTITPNAGGAGAVSAHLTVIQIA